MKSKGFTLIELMIVIAIIGILCAIAIPNFLKYQCRTRGKKLNINTSIINSVCANSRNADTREVFKKIANGSPAHNFLSADEIKKLKDAGVDVEMPMLETETKTNRCEKQESIIKELLFQIKQLRKHEPPNEQQQEIQSWKH